MCSATASMVLLLFRTEMYSATAIFVLNFAAGNMKNFVAEFYTEYCCLFCDQSSEHNVDSSIDFADGRRIL